MQEAKMRIKMLHLKWKLSKRVPNKAKRKEFSLIRKGLVIKS